MNSPQTPATAHEHAAALQALFPGGVAALESSKLRSLLTEYVECRARYSGPMEAPTARAGAFFEPGAGAPYALRPGGVAVIELGGLMLQRPGFLARVFLGAVDTVEIAAAVEAAGRDSSVRSVLMQINSPGGAVHGTAELAAAVSGVGTMKPVVAVTEGAACSAAYWVASACSQVYGSSPTVLAGSIGVVSVHTYTPSADKAVVTEIKSGKFKTVGSSSKPLSDDDLAHLQERIDYMATQFINAVALNRGLSASAVAGQEARVYIGQQAIGAGLLDGIASVRELERELAKDPGRFMRRRGGVSIKPASSSSAPQPVNAPKVAPAPVMQKSEYDTRAEAAGQVLQYRRATGQWPGRVMTWTEWEKVGQARASKDGCTVIEGIKREGYVHPRVNLPQADEPGSQGGQLTLKLTDQQLAERAKAWADFKGLTVLQAMRYLGFSEVWHSRMMERAFPQ